MCQKVEKGRAEVTYISFNNYCIIRLKFNFL